MQTKICVGHFAVAIMALLVYFVAHDNGSITEQSQAQTVNQIPACIDGQDNVHYKQMIAEFATLIGLVCNFRQEKGGREALDHQKFIEWLQYHRHQDPTSRNVLTECASIA